MSTSAEQGGALAQLAVDLYRASAHGIEEFRIASDALTMEIASFEGHPLHDSDFDAGDLTWMMCRLAAAMAADRSAKEPDGPERVLKAFVDVFAERI